MALFYSLFLVLTVGASASDMWITPCGLVYNKFNSRHYRMLQGPIMMERLRTHFGSAENLVTRNLHLGIIEELPYDQDKDFGIIPPQMLNIQKYLRLETEQVFRVLLPEMYKTLQHLTAALEIVHSEIREGADNVKKEFAVERIIAKNAELICQLDLVMRSFDIPFTIIEKLTLPKEWTDAYGDHTFSQIKHSRVLIVYRTYIKSALAIFSKFYYVS